MFRIICTLIFVSFVVVGCVQQDASPLTADESEVGGPPPPGGGVCGNTVCSKDQFCCSNGCTLICVELGGGCTQEACLAGEDDETLASEAVTDGEPGVAHEVGVIE